MMELAKVIIINNIALIIYSSLIIALILNLKKKTSLIICMAIAFISPKFSNINGLIKTLGTDSVSEGLNFNIEEALFYIGTLSEVINTDVRTYAITLAAIISLSTTLYFLQIKSHSITKKTYLMTLSILSVVFAYNVHSIFTEDIFEHNIIKNNFTKINHLNNMELFPKNDIDIIIYIGESTTKSHMSVYGYYRKTTPNLDALKNKNELLIFKDVFSTHSHTSPSLLEALSISNKNFPERLETIYEKKEYQ